MAKIEKNLGLLQTVVLILLLNGAVYAQHFTSVDPTGESRPVVIQDATIDGVQIVPGDEIAVFDDTLCVGAGVFQGTFPVPIAVWMEVILPDFTVLPGAKAGNSMSFKIWQQSSDMELPATPTYSLGTGIFDEPLTVVTLLEAVGLSPPVADADGPYAGVVNEPVAFDGSGSYDLDGTVISYDWDFGDGNFGTGVNPTHAYANYDTFQVILMVTDNDGLTDNDTSTAIITFSAHFTSVNPTGESRPVVIQNATIEGTVIVAGDEIAVFDDTLCVGAEIFQGTFPVTIASWMEVTLPDATVLPGAQADSTMIFKVWQSSSKTECLATPTYLVGDGTFDNPLTVVSLLEAFIPRPPGADAGGPYTGVISEPVAFDGSGSFDIDGNIVSYDWDFGDGSTAQGDTLIHPTHIYDDTGTYQVVLTVTDNDGLTGKDTADVSIFPTGVEAWRQGEVPDKFELSQNYPNPFNPETVMRYQIPRDRHVVLEVYNMMGQRVKILLNEMKQPGYYEAEWNGRDESGRSLGSGVYLVRMAAGNFVDLKKVILMK